MPRWPQAPGAEDRLQAALTAWRVGDLYKSAEACAKAHGVQPTTFRKRLQGKHRSHHDAHTNQYRITPAGEAAIVRHCIYLAKAGFPCRYYTIRTIATLILRRENSHLPLYHNIAPLGKCWIYSFLKRQDELRTCYVRSISLERAIASNNPALIKRFFSNYSNAKTQYNIKDADVWNIDETGYAMGFAYGAKVVVLRGSIINFKTIDGSREWVSQIDSIGMHGQTIPPFIIFKGRQHTESLWQEAEEAIGECTLAMSKNGWSNQELGVRWLEHFERYTRRTEAWQRPIEDSNNSEYNGYRLLIMDGHSSHVNIEFVELCWSKKIVPICLPPHSTHLLQPLDLVIFSVVKRLYSSKVDEYAACGITGINREYFLKILGEIRPQIYTRELIRSAFEAAGLYPFDPNRALDRCSAQPSSTQLSTPPPSLEHATILSSPIHPPPPNSEHARARYARTILHPETAPEATEAVVSKLMQHLQSLEDGLEIMQAENNKLRQHTKERKAKKKRKRTVISTESVLTLEAVRELAAAKCAADEAKEQARLAKEQLKKDRQVAVALVRKQIDARKVARKKAADIRKLAKEHHREAAEAVKVASKAQKNSLTAANIARKKKTKEARIAAQIAADYASLKQSAAEELQKRAADSIIAIAAAAALIKQLQDAANKGVGGAALLEDTQQGQEDDDTSDLGDEESSDEDVESIGDLWGPIDWPIEL